MSPEVIVRKLAAMGRYLDDLCVHRGDDFKRFMEQHYRIERLIELLVMCASDISFHLLSLRGEDPPGSYRAAFLRLGEMNLLAPDLSRNLALGVGLRNILAHQYEAVDHRLLHENLPKIIDDMIAFMKTVTALPEIGI